MNKWSKIIIVIIMLLVVLKFSGYDKSQIILPDAAELESIVLSEPTKKNSRCVTIEDTKENRAIINNIKMNSSKTIIESLNDNPVNISDYIKVEFSHKDETSVMYLYKENGNYYVEQPYIGVWKVAGSTYDYIVSEFNSKNK